MISILPDLKSCFFQVSNGVRVRVRLTPNAGQNRIDGLALDGQGNTVLRIAVNAQPEQGRANKAMIKYIAKQWRVPKSKITLQTGAKDRIKTLHIDDNNPDLLNTLEKWARQFDAPLR